MNNEDLFQMKGKSVLVTGATGYLGRAMVETLTRQGAFVFVNGRDKDQVESFVEDLNKKERVAQSAIFDITDESSVDKFMANNKIHELDVLINNAYAGSSGSIESSSDEDYRKSYEVGLVSAQRLVKKFLPALRRAKEKRGDASVINIGSMYGVVSPDLNIYESKKMANPPFYGAMKAALIQWTKYAACEFGCEGVRFNVISPGPFPSEEVLANNNDFVKRLSLKSPLGRTGNANELKGPILFLASCASSYVTGANIVVDGGWTAW